VNNTKSEVKRETEETKVSVNLNLYGSGNVSVSTQIPFLDHMLKSFGKHGGLDLKIKAKGDTEVGEHHTVEDVGITLGEAIKEAINRDEIKRFGNASVPMDEAICNASVDLGGRSYLVMQSPEGVVSGISTVLFKHFFRSVCENGDITLHLYVYGDDPHHFIEAAFKSFGRAFKEGLERSDIEGTPSTKGKVRRF